tara:strand:- start:2911 stop:4869 length:1959 start_codon:yes stop_codon:yes gene_type:complete
MTYHHYIDGLRAIAVVLVMLFHLEPEIFKGGYLGVDVFFVISGFVISQSIYKNYLKTNTVQIGSFYLRRLKRLYPALVAMVSVTTLVYFFLGFLWDTNLLIKSSVTSILAVSNFYYLKQADNYFHQDLINPLLHTWSLGIEEQFYLIFPLLMLGLFRLFKNNNDQVKYLLYVITGLSVLSYVSFVVFADSMWGSYYFPTARFWEIGVGCALFFLSLKIKDIKYGAGLIITGIILLFSTQLLVPVLNVVQIETLLAVIATSLIIIAGLTNKTAIIAFLENKYFLHIGKISYSLYLWHLPVFYFTNLYLNSLAYYLVALSLTFVLSWASYYLIENPFRHSAWLEDNLNKLKYLVVSGGTAAIVFIVGVGPGSVVLAVNQGLNTFSDEVKTVNYIERSYDLGERIQPNHFETELDCEEEINGRELFAGAPRGICGNEDQSKRLIYLTGDSHARHLVPMMDAAQVQSDIYFYPGENQMIHLGEAGTSNPNLTIEKHRERLEVLQEDYDEIVVISSLFLSPYEDRIDDSRTNMIEYIKTISPFAEIVLVAPTPVFPTGPESCVVTGQHCTLDKTIDLKRVAVTYDLLADAADGNDRVYLFDLYDQICPHEVCSIYEEDQDFLKYMDDDHLSVEGSLSLTSYFESWFTSTFEDIEDGN